MDNQTKTKIGKDVIESLTLGMYEDSRFIYREYIQNSADQIDLAVEQGLLGELSDGRIEIEIKPSESYISITDNATGIESSQVQAILKNIAKSTKDRSKNKGFRGIGRLGGLAYCDRLIFETSFKGEPVKSYLTWDAQKLKAIINNRATKEDAISVIDEVTEFSQEKEKEEAHYFKVSLEGVNNEALLEKESIVEYLSMVAPVPFGKGFIYKGKIHQKANELSCPFDEYSIYVNRDQIFKAYTTSIYEGEKNNKKKIDDVTDVEFFELHDKNEKLLGWGWYGISTFKKVLPKVNTAGGIRLRKGNIQIGLEDAMKKLFKENRGSRYYFGEIHAISPQLIPNARRDYFLENETCTKFEHLLKIKFDELHKLYYFASKIRNEQKKIDDLEVASKKLEEKVDKGGFTDDKERKIYQEQYEQKKGKAELAEKELAKARDRVATQPTAYAKIFAKVTENKPSKVEEVAVAIPTKTTYITDSMSALKRKDRKLVSRIFSVIDNVLPKDLSNILKEKIKEELQ